MSLYLPYLSDTVDNQYMRLCSNEHILCKKMRELSKEHMQRHVRLVSLYMFVLTGLRSLPYNNRTIEIR